MNARKTNAEIAREILDNTRPAPGTLLDTYFRSRGITPPEPVPECLRFAPKLAHPNEQYFPAMIAQLTNPMTGAPTGGIQRTFLALTGKGKAEVESGQQKLSLGPCRGGVVRLAEPIKGKPLILGEGVETVLTVMEATGSPGWATLGTSGFANLELPNNVTEVVLLAENDGGPNEKALSQVLPALTARGVRALLARPPAGVKDFNDLVNGKSGHLPEAGRIVVKETIEAARRTEAEAQAEAEAEAENNLGSGLIDQSQKTTAAATQIAEK
jgi:putative DNA primase/helicase